MESSAPSSSSVPSSESSTPAVNGVAKEAPNLKDPSITWFPAGERYWLHGLLFFLTLATTTHMGASMAGRALAYQDTSLLMGGIHLGWLLDGLRYSVPFLAFLTVHEFGHYFATRIHRINASLPYYIPLPFIPPTGTLGAVISIREPIPSTRRLFDVGAAGPLAGFVVALGALLYGFVTLPGPEYLLDLQGHEAIKEYIRQNGTYPATMPPGPEGQLTLVVGQTPLFWLLSQFFPHVPPMYEVYHFPVLFAGWLGLFFTALNLLPVGQLDGGHILYALFGKTWHRRLAVAFVFVLLLSGGIGFIEETRDWFAAYGAMGPPLAYGALSSIFLVYLYRVFNGHLRPMGMGLVGLLVGVGVIEGVFTSFTTYGYSGWLVWTALVVFLVRVQHPPVVQPEPLTPTRRALGYASIVIFLLCFSIKPLSVV